MWSQIFQIVLAGIAIGCVYALIALGFVLIYKATEVVNFAQGAAMAVGAFIALTFVDYVGLPYWLAIVGAIAIMAAIGGGVERLVIRPVLGQPQFSIVMVTIGLVFFARGFISFLPAWGTQTYSLPTPVSGITLHLGSAAISANYLAVILVTLVLFLVLYLFFRYTRVGIAMQAISQSQIAAYYMGIPVGRINTLIWCISAGVATIAGVLLAPITFVHAHMGLIALKAFPAAVLGGFGSIPGAIIGALIIGLVEAFAGRYLPDGWSDVAAYVVLLIVLVVKPTGLFGEQLTKKV